MYKTNSYFRKDIVNLERSLGPSKKPAKALIIVGFSTLVLSWIAIYALIASQNQLFCPKWLDHSIKWLVHTIDFEKTCLLVSTVGFLGIGLLIYGVKKHKERPAFNVSEAIQKARRERIKEIAESVAHPLKMISGENKFKKDVRTEPLCKNNKYYYQEGQPNHGREALFIFLETQAKRVARLFTLGKYFKYITAQEKREAYQWDKPEVNPQVSTYQNIGHATLLFQVNGFNVLTDPVFGDINPILYPRKTKAGLRPEELPPIDVILISHNHRDHCDIDSLKKLVPFQPALLVPKGDMKLFTDLGFTHVKEHDWFEKTTVKRKADGKSIDFFSLPARHWSGRGLFDAQKSMTCSWAFVGNKEEGAVYFRGDTANIPKVTMKEIREFVEAPIIVNFEPGGPNYSRRWMESTHQSVLDSIISHFEVADKEVQVNTYLMHHNAFELGTDRFNEAIKIKDQIITFLEAYKKDPTSENEAWNKLPLFVFNELKTGKLLTIETIGIDRFISEMKSHFFSPKIGEKGALFA